MQFAFFAISFHYSISTTDCADTRDYLACARDLHLWNLEYLWFIYLNTDCTNLKDYLAYARDEYLGDRYFFRTQITQIEEIFSQGSTSYASVSLALVIYICVIPDICGQTLSPNL